MRPTRSVVSIAVSCLAITLSACFGTETGPSANVSLAEQAGKPSDPPRAAGNGIDPMEPGARLGGDDCQDPRDCDDFCDDFPDDPECDDGGGSDPVPCVLLDFEVDDRGVDLEPGLVVGNSDGTVAGPYEGDDFGVSIYAWRGPDKNAFGMARLFDSGNPTGGDSDLGYDDPPRGNILIVEEGNGTQPPDDNAGGATIEFRIDGSRCFSGLTVLDIDANEDPARIEVIDYDDSTDTETLLAMIEVDPTGNNGFRELADIEVCGTNRVRFSHHSSVAIDDLVLCEEDEPCEVNACGVFCGPLTDVEGVPLEDEVGIGDLCSGDPDDGSGQEGGGAGGAGGAQEDGISTIEVPGGDPTCEEVCVYACTPDGHVTCACDCVPIPDSEGNLTYIQESADGTLEIYVVDDTGNNRVQVTDFSPMVIFENKPEHPQFSPSGDAIAVSARRSADASIETGHRYWALRPDGSDLRVLEEEGEDVDPDSTRTRDFSWAGDGRIVYGRGIIDPASPFPEAQFESALYRLDIANPPLGLPPGPRTLIYEHPSGGSGQLYATEPSVAPLGLGEGRILFLLEDEGEGRLLHLLEDGVAAPVIDATVGDPIAGVEANWSEAGDRFAYALGDTLFLHPYVPVDGTPASSQPIFTFPGGNPVQLGPPAWGNGDERIYTAACDVDGLPGNEELENCRIIAIDVASGQAESLGVDLLANHLDLSWGTPGDIDRDGDGFADGMPAPIP